MASASAPAPRRSARARRPLPQPADGAMASKSAPRRSARARRPLAQPADSAMASTSARRRTTGARRRPPPQAAASTSARRRSARGLEAQTFLPDEIWEDIFLRLDAAADLARASAACSTFRRVVSERRFLRRFRSLPSPPILGFTHGDLYAAVDPPHRSAPEAGALEEAADFTFSFLPGGCFRHASDGRVLFVRRNSPDSEFDDAFLVCDPLYRRYVKIPRIPDDLRASAAYSGDGTSNYVFPILTPGGENDEEESFRIICTVQLRHKVVVFIFSSCDQTWRGIITTIRLPGLVSMPYYAHGCVHWMLDCTSSALSLVLDTSGMEFSIIDLPPPASSTADRAIVEAREGRLGLVTIIDGKVDLYCKNWQNNGVGAQDWQHEKMIPLPRRINYIWSIVGTAGRYIGLLHQLGMHCKYFVLDIKTMLLEELCTLKKGVMFVGFPYARFPPPLALPSI